MIARRIVFSACVTVLFLAAAIFAVRAGFWISGLLAATAGVGFAVTYWSLVIQPARLRPNTLLVVRLSGPLKEVEYLPRWSELLGRFSPTLSQLRVVLEAAVRDPAIAAVLVELDGAEIGFAVAEELGELLDSLRERGKRVTAVLAGDSVDLRQYLVASAANEIVMNPNSMLAMVGTSIGSLFIKGALDRLLIDAQVLQWKEYKGFAETFSRSNMSPELRDSLEALVNDWAEIAAERIAMRRGLTPDLARSRIRAGFLAADDARALGLVDKIGHREELEAQFAGPDGERRVVEVERYLRRARYLQRARGAARLALVTGIGPVVAGDQPAGEFLAAGRVAAALHAAARDRRVRAIVFRVDSPGGSAAASETVWRAVKEARTCGKPVVVSMGNIAASGGYYVAAGADKIVANAGTISGSIGVVYAKLSFGRLMERIGINMDVAKTADSADGLLPTRRLTESELAQLDHVMGEVYHRFLSRVGEGRGLNVEETDRIARGRVWSGVAAKAHGLVDATGGMRTAIALAREAAGLAVNQPHELVAYGPGALRLLPRWVTPLARFLAADGNARTAWPGATENWLPTLFSMTRSGAPLLLSPIIRV